MKYNNMIGQKFGSLLVIAHDSRKNKKGQAYWICECDCGRFLSVRGDQLRLGGSTQCSACLGKGRLSRFVEEGDIHD